MTMNKRMLIAIICAIVMFILYLAGKLDHTNGTIIGGFAFVVVFLGSLENEMRYQSPQLVSQTVRGSIDLETMLTVGDWCALPLGTIKSEKWYAFYEGGQGTVIFKKHSPLSMVLYKVGDGNAVLLTAPVPKDESDIDPDLREAMVKRSGFKPPYYISDLPKNPDPVHTTTSPSATGTPATGIPESQKVDVSKLVKENQAYRREINVLRDALRGKNAMIDREMARIAGAAKSLGLTKWDRWFRKEETRPPSEG